MRGAVLNIRSSVRWNSLVQHSLMVETRKNGHSLFLRKFHAINLNGTNAVSIRKLVEVLLAHTDVVHLGVGYQFLKKKAPAVTFYL